MFTNVTTISPRQFCESLYCGVVPYNAFTVDQITRRMALEVQVTFRSQSTTHRVVFEGVRDLVHKHPDNQTDSPNVDDRLELSVIEVEREPTAWRAWFHPWYVHEIEFRCDRMLLDNAEVVGSGRWVQDDLPRSAG